MKSSKEIKSFYFVVNIALGIIAAILLMPRLGPIPLQYLRKGAGVKLRSFMNQAIKLRDSVYTIRKKEEQFINRNPNPVEIGSETEKQAYEEQKRNYLGG
jgi:hypothetical protein